MWVGGFVCVVGLLVHAAALPTNDANPSTAQATPQDALQAALAPPQGMFEQQAPATTTPVVAVDTNPVATTTQPNTPNVDTKIATGATNFASVGSTPTISVCVPCIPRDAEKLPRLLRSINEQTMAPFEVLIAISETSAEEGARLEEKLKSIVPTTTVLATTEKLRAMPNRKRAAQWASGNYVSFIDADDEMHPQKIQIVSEVLRENDFAVLIHSFVLDKSKASNLRFDWHKAPLERGAAIAANTAAKDVERGYPPGSDGKLAIVAKGLVCKSKKGKIGPHHGHPTVKRDVVLQVPTLTDKRGQDIKFLRSVFALLGNKDSTLGFINLPLTYYHPSNHPDNNKYQGISHSPESLNADAEEDEAEVEWEYNADVVTATLP